MGKEILNARISQENSSSSGSGEAAEEMEDVPGNSDEEEVIKIDAEDCGILSAVYTKDLKINLIVASDDESCEDEASG